MKRVLAIVGVVLGLLAALALAHLAFIEIGREVVTLRTPSGDGWQETRLWIVDDDGAAWLHSAGEGWRERFEGDPIVEVVRGGETLPFRAHAIPGPHPRVDALLREKYGIADRWVRFLAPCDETVVPVRLEPLPR